MAEIHCIMVVWGQAHRDVLLRGSLPSQLASGNLPALKQNALVKYHLFTTQEDWDVICLHPLFNQLQNCCDVVFRKITSGPDTFKLLTSCHSVALEEEGPLFFLEPDGIYSQGSLSFIWQQIQKGKRIVFTQTPRLLREEYLQRLERIAIEKRFQSRTLVREAMHVLHPITRALIWGKEQISLWPSQLYWIMPDSAGFIAHCFHSHPTMVWPRKKGIIELTIDDGSCLKMCPDPEEWHLMQDSDECAIFELSPSWHGDIETMPATLRNIALNLIVITEPFHRQFAKKPVFFRSVEGSFKELAQESQEILDQLVHRITHPQFADWAKTLSSFVKRRVQRMPRIRRIVRCRKKVYRFCKRLLYRTDRYSL